MDYGIRYSKKLYHTIETAAAMTDSVIVGFSGGKDSAVTLDLCFRYFKNVRAYFMYFVKGLEFQEVTLRYYEKRYDTEIIRLPHFMLSEFLKYGTYRLPDLDVPITNMKETYNYVRKQTGIHWIAAGERIADSIVRRAMIKHSGSIDPVRGRIYPLANWNKKEVLDYVAWRKLPLSLENKVLESSFSGLEGKDIIRIREHFPDDYEKIRRAFPLVEAGIIHYQMQKESEEYENSEDCTEQD